MIMGDAVVDDGQGWFIVLKIGEQEWVIISNSNEWEIQL